MGQLLEDDNGKELFIEESGFAWKLNESSSSCVRKYLDEDTTSANLGDIGKQNILVLRNIPACICNIPTKNGRIYSSKEMKKAIKKSQSAFLNKSLLCSGKGHPSEAKVEPTEASHIVVDAYIKKVQDQDVLFNDWQILSTYEGKNLASLIKDGVSVGTSIRVFGNVSDDNDNNVKDIDFLGTDAVGAPAAGTYLSMNSAKAEIMSSEEVMKRNDSQELIGEEEENPMLRRNSGRFRSSLLRRGGRGRFGESVRERSLRRRQLRREDEDYTGYEDIIDDDERYRDRNDDENYNDIRDDDDDDERHFDNRSRRRGRSPLSMRDDDYVSLESESGATNEMVDFGKDLGKVKKLVDALASKVRNAKDENSKSK